jgi:hypothetical protein
MAKGCRGRVVRSFSDIVVSSSAEYPSLVHLGGAAPLQNPSMGINIRELSCWGLPSGSKIKRTLCIVIGGLQSFASLCSFSRATIHSSEKLFSNDYAFFGKYSPPPFRRVPRHPVAVFLRTLPLHVFMGSPEVKSISDASLCAPICFGRV